MGMAYAFKKGELAQNEVSPDVIQLANSMTLKQLKDFAETTHEGLHNCNVLGFWYKPEASEVYVS